MTARPGWQATIGWAVWASLLFTLLFLTEDRDSALLRTGSGSTSATTARGLSRLYDALLEVGVPAGRVRKHDELSQDTTLVIIDPPPMKAGVTAPAFDEHLVRAGLLDVVVAGTRRQILAACPMLADEEGVPDVRITGGARVTADLPWTPKSIATPHGVRAFDGRPSNDEVLAVGNDGSPVALLRRFGRGHVIYCAEPGLFENEYITLADNARFALALCATRASVTFDDRWVITAQAQAGDFSTMSLVYGTTVGRALTALVLTLALGLHLRAIRVGGPTDVSIERPPVTAYVDALAEAMLAARKGGLALRSFQDAFRRSAARRLGLPPDVTAETLAGVLSNITGEDAEKIRALLEESAPDAEVASKVRELDALGRRTGT